MPVATHDPMSIPLLLAALACIVVGLFPHRDRHIDSRTHEPVITWTVGLPFSPVGTSVNRWAPDGTFDTKGKIQFVSWSWASIVMGVILLVWRRRRRSKHQNAEETAVSK